MHKTTQKEQFSIAYFHAIAAVCGLKISRCDVDDESIDLTVGKTGGDGTIRSPRLDVQLKCTELDVLKEDGVHFKLKRKNYDDLRESELHVPRILVVLIVPKNLADWCVNSAETSLCLRQNAWWMSLKGADEKPTIGKPMVILPRTQLFHTESLSQIMDRVGKKEAL